MFGIGIQELIVIVVVVLVVGVLIASMKRPRK
jgi:hypothetical protein